MSFAEVNVLGVYIAPMSVMLLAAWIVTITLRRFAAQYGLLSYVWHPALFVFSVYLIVLSSITFIVAS
jgi:protein AaeX